MMWIRFLIAAVLVLQLPRLMAHQETWQQIALLSQELARNPASTQTLLRRGELYLEHDVLDAALNDFEAALRQDPEAVHPRLNLVLVYLKKQKHDRAREEAVRLTREHPEDAESWIALSHVEAATSKPLAAAEALKHAIRFSRNRSPELYRRRAQHLVEAGEAHRETALAALQEGISRHGHLIALEEAALDLERDSRKYAEALNRLEGLLERSSRKEHWLVRKGEILRAKGDVEGSRAAFEQALQEIQSLDPRQHETTATRELQRKAELGIESTAR